MSSPDTEFSLPRRVLTLLYTWKLRMSANHWGRGVRIFPPAVIVGADGIELGDRVVIREHAWLNTKGKRDDGKPALTIGAGSYIGRFAHINAWHEVVIEPEVLIADRVYISDADHHFADRQIPILRQGDSFKGKVLLRSGCWIGVGAVILPGVTIGRNAIVGANAVVTKDVPDYMIVGGIPAKVIREI